MRWMGGAAYNGEPMYCTRPKLYTSPVGMCSMFSRPRPHLVSSGVWYFHVSSRNSLASVRGKVSRMTVQTA